MHQRPCVCMCVCVGVCEHARVHLSFPFMCPCLFFCLGSLWKWHEPEFLRCVCLQIYGSQDFHFYIRRLVVEVMVGVVIEPHVDTRFRTAAWIQRGSNRRKTTSVLAAKCASGGSDAGAMPIFNLYIQAYSQQIPTQLKSAPVCTYTCELISCSIQQS